MNRNTWNEDLLLELLRLLFNLGAVAVFVIGVALFVDALINRKKR